MAGVTFFAVSAGATERRILGAVQWPDALHAEGVEFLVTSLLAERTGSVSAARQLLARGTLEPTERARFLAERAFFPPEPEERLAAQVDLEDVVADFGQVLRAIRALPSGDRVEFALF